MAFCMQQDISKERSQQEAVTLMLPWKGFTSTCGVNGVQSRGSREGWTVRRTKDQARNVCAWVMSLTGAENGGMAQGPFRYPSNRSCLCSQQLYVSVQRHQKGPDIGVSPCSLNSPYSAWHVRGTQYMFVIWDGINGMMGQDGMMGWKR